MSAATRDLNTPSTMISSTLSPRRALLLGAAAVAVALPAAAQKSDVVYRTNPRTGKTQALQGTVTGDGLAKLEITLRGGDTKSYDSLEIVQVIWGDVPEPFVDGQKFSRRGDWENAVSSYQDAAGGSATRGPVKAAARLAAVEALLEWGQSQPARFGDAVAEADRFISEFSDNRFFPRVRALKARAAWLSGDAAAARDGYKALFDAGKGGAEGYAPIEVAEAALHAGQAAIAAGDTGTARELFTSAEGAFRDIASSDDSPFAQRAAAGQEIAGLGESFSRVAREDFAGARSGLERAVDRMETAGGKAQARLLLGQALAGLGEHQAALSQLARVSGMDHTSRDRRAAALLSLAKAEMALAPEKGAAAAKIALETVVSAYGDTPSAGAARTLLASF